MAVTDSVNNVASVIKAYYDKRFLMRADAEFVYKQLGRVGVIPKGEGR